MSDVYVFLLDSADDIFSSICPSRSSENLAKFVLNTRDAPSAFAQLNCFHLEQKNWRTRANVPAYFRNPNRRSVLEALPSVSLRMISEHLDWQEPNSCSGVPQTAQPENCHDLAR